MQCSCLHYGEAIVVFCTSHTGCVIYNSLGSHKHSHHWAHFSYLISALYYKILHFIMLAEYQNYVKQVTHGKTIDRQKAANVQELLGDIL